MICYNYYVSVGEYISREQFLDDKADYSHLLAHLTRSNPKMTAKEVLSQILDEGLLVAFNAFCICRYDFYQEEDADLRNMLRVVCFTETPLEQIKLLLKNVYGREHQPDPYGLVFTKSFIREKGGNPVFYISSELAKPLRAFFLKNARKLPKSMFRVLALTSLCDDTEEVRNDWHWEREWRVVGHLDFKLENVYCGFCRQEDITYFQDKYAPIRFIDPRWSGKRILDELVRQQPSTTDIEDIPF